MATDKSFFGRLKTLFSTATFTVKDSGEVNVVDINKQQSQSKLATNRIIDRYNKLWSSSQSYGYNQQSSYFTQRLILFGDYEAMDSDPIIASALDIYSDESTTKDEYGDILTIRSSKTDIEEKLNNLFYNVLNIQFNLWMWIRNMCKYGDFYLKLDITETLGVTNVIPISTYEMIREEGLDPEKPEYVRFRQDKSVGGNYMGASSAGSMMYYENYEIAHFRLISDANFLPYGKSMIENARKIWKQVTLMEDAMMIHRIMRAPERRIFKIDVGNIPSNEVEQYIQRVINETKKAPYLDRDTGQYDLKYNLTNMMEDYYLPVRGGTTGTEIDTLSGMEWTGIDDINYLKEKMFAALKIPKAFLGYEEGVEGKATLAAQDVRFARTIEHIQKIVVSELTKIAIVHLYSLGYTEGDLVDFELSLTNASTIHEQEQIELWNQKISLADQIKSNQLLSTNWIYKNIFNLTDEDIKKESANVVEDTKREFRLSTIQNEGTDPKNPPAEGGGLTSDDEDDGEKELSGRPPEGPKYGTQDSARGRDPLGDETRQRDIKNRDRGVTSEEKYYMVKSMFGGDQPENVSSNGLLNEDNIIGNN